MHPELKSVTKEVTVMEKHAIVVHRQASFESYHCSTDYETADHSAE